MRVALLRRSPSASFSMDVYADGLAYGLRAVRPDWKIDEYSPKISAANVGLGGIGNGLHKYYERYWRYPRSLRQVDADIFHVIDHTHAYLSRWLDSADYPNVVTCHDLINLTMPESFVGRARFPKVSMAAWRWGVTGMRDADHTIAVSSYTKQDMITHLDMSPESVTVIPNAVGSSFRVLSDEIIQSTREQYGLSPDDFCVLNVGSNNVRKNILTLIESVADLADAGLPVHFWKAGADFSLPQKQMIQTRNIEHCVTYLGQPEPEALVAIYNAADVLVAPSLYEGFGLTVLEAMACATAVIAANVTSLPEVVGDAAMLVSPTDKQAITSAIRQLYEQPDLCQTLAQRGLSRAQNFTWEKTAERLAKVYESVLLSHSGGHL